MRKWPRSGSAKLVHAAAALALAGCAGQMRFPVSQEAQDALATQNINVVRIMTENIAQYHQPASALRDGRSADSKTDGMLQTDATAVPKYAFPPSL